MNIKNVFNSIVHKRTMLTRLYPTKNVKVRPFVPPLDITYDLTAPECEVCGNRSEFNNKMMLTRGPSGFSIMNYSPVGDCVRHVLCLKCLDYSISLLEDFGSRPLRDMPLYINDKNPFIRELSRVRLNDAY